MAAEQPRTPSPDAGGSPLDRRTFIKGAGVGLGAATIGVSPQISPIGKSEAIAPLVAGAAVGAAFCAGVVAAEWGTDAPEIDGSDVLEDEIYNTVVSVSQGRESFEQELQTQFVDRPSNQTPYANAAWQNIRAEATKVIVDGGSQADAEQAAIDALQRQTTRSLVNIIERWNTFVKGIANGYVRDLNNGIGVLQTSASGISPATGSPQTSGWTTVHLSDESESTGLLHKSDPIPTPTDPTNLEGREEPLVIYGLQMSQSAGDIKHSAPMITQTQFTYSGLQISNGYEYLTATHPNLSTQNLIDIKVYTDALAAIDTAYDTITSDLSTYVEQLYNGISEGAIDPNNILSSQDIVEKSANSSEQARLAAEIMAIGGTVPDEIGYQATISHPDLASDSLKGWLYPQFGESSTIPIAAGTTLQPEDYEMAYFGYESAVDGDFETRVLSGEKALDVLEVEGIEDSSESAESDSASSTVGTDGVVTIWDDSATDKATPDPLTNPSNYDGWIVRIEATDGTTDMVPLSAVTDNGDGTYQVTTTALSSGTEISKVSIEPGADYEQPVTHVSDATNIDTAETRALLKEQQETYEALKEALEEDDDPLAGGGLLSDGGLPTIPGLGVVGTVGAALLALAGVNAATN